MDLGIGDAAVGDGLGVPVAETTSGAVNLEALSPQNEALSGHGHAEEGDLVLDYHGELGGNLQRRMSSAWRARRVEQVLLWLGWTVAALTVVGVVAFSLLWVTVVLDRPSELPGQPPARHQPPLAMNNSGVH